MKFRYKIIIALTLSSILFNLIFGFFTIKKELDSEREQFKNKIDNYNSLIQLMNVMPLWDFDTEKIRSNLDLIFRDPEVVVISLKDMTGNINFTLRKEDRYKDGKIFPHKLDIVKNEDKLGEAYIEYTNSIYIERLTGLVIERILFTMGLIVINAVIVFLISSYLLRPIDSVVNGLRKVDEGDFNHRMNINTVDEFKQIEIYFNRMVETLSMEIQSRIEKEDQLVDIHKYLKSVFDSIPSVLVSVDKFGSVKQWNSEAENFTGVSYPDALNKSIWDLIPILEEYRNAFNAVINEEKTDEIRRQYASPEKDRYIDISFSPLISGRGSGAVIRLDDVTAMKEKDEKLGHAQMMDTIGNLAGGLAHDFNNVLAGITSTVSLIKFRIQRGDEPGAAEMKKFLDIMEDSGVRASDLTKQLLSLSRRDEMTFKLTDLNEVLKKVIEFCSHTLDKSIEINPVFFNSDALVLADSVRLEQVFLNLLINASHSMTVMRREGEARGGKILINIEKQTVDEFFCNSRTDAIPGIDYWVVSIMDNGIGIDKKILQKIFEPFFTTKGRGKGSGLGLAMSYNIVRQHGGFIDVSSEPGKGSNFSIYIPVAETKTADLVKSDVGISGGSGLILVIDDEKSMCEMASSMLKIFGYDVIAADDSEKGLEIFKENNISISAVLLDMIMPKKTGGELFKIFKEINPAVPVVIMSGFGEDESIKKLLDNGVSLFLQKPFSMEALASAMDKAINS